MSGARGLVVAGTASGVGKTSLTLGLLEACRRRGLRVQAFKVGPDFIDPAFHALVTGRPSYNLDGWMCGRDGVVAAVARHAADADVALVEGVMGCFDGVDGSGEDGSTAQVAKWLGLPVALVLDAGAQARSAAAVTLGFEQFDPHLAVAAVVVNRVGGDRHAGWVRDAVRAACRAEVLGAIPHDAGLALPERHLGLVTAAEGPLTPALRARLAETVERFVDVDRLLALAAPLAGPAPVVAPRVRPRARVGVARDLAFQFYYAENLDLLERAGAELVFWSPLADATPPEADGLYLGGGYPELHARALADNASMRTALRRFAAAGRPVYAECGGLMLLAESLEDDAGIAHPMVGVLPARVRMRPRRMTLGYAEVTLTAATPLGPAGVSARGQAFHFSVLDPVPDGVARVYRRKATHGAVAAEGYLVGQTLMSYLHLHWGASPAMAEAFVAACAGGRR